MEFQRFFRVFYLTPETAMEFQGIPETSMEFHGTPPSKFFFTRFPGIPRTQGIP
jgi:hypothetical protein